MAKLVITSLYKEYFQKSRVFLYPALDIKRGVSTTPIETHMSWKGHYLPKEMKLCCLYYLRDDEDFKIFEKNKLLGNKYFHEFKQVDSDKGVYVFDLSYLKDDWKAVHAGKYSKISDNFKSKIRNYIGLSSPHLPYIDSFLYPERHFQLYAELMNVDECLLKKVGELCSVPDYDLETLDISVLDFSMNTKKV